MSKPTPEIVKDLAPTGTLRVALNLGNSVLVQKDASGKTKGITVDLANELGKRLGVPVQFAEFEGAGKAFEGIKTGTLDIMFLAIEPVRANEITFTAPYVIIEGVYLVPNESKLQTVEDVDQPGIRVAVNKGSAYDLFLSRSLKNATLVRGDGGPKIFKEQGLEACGGVKQNQQAYMKKDPSVRLIPGRFMEIRQAMGTPKGRGAAGEKYLHAFVEEMKASGFIADALKRSGQDAEVAPPG
jgi:polar amino acid transport system substrate-binding protein